MTNNNSSFQDIHIKHLANGKIEVVFKEHPHLHVEEQVFASTRELLEFLNLKMQPFFNPSEWL